MINLAGGFTNQLLRGSSSKSSSWGDTPNYLFEYNNGTTAGISINRLKALLRPSASNTSSQKELVGRLEEYDLYDVVMDDGIDLLQMQFLDWVNGEVDEVDDGTSISPRLVPFMNEQEGKTNDNQLSETNKTKLPATTSLSTPLHKPSVATRMEMIGEMNHIVTTLTTMLYGFIHPHRKSIHDLQSQYHGRGIVMSIGNWYFNFSIHAIQSLRLTGCQLPIEIYYAGDEDLDYEKRVALRSMDGVIGVYDLSNVVGGLEGKRLKGFSLKPFAMVASRFKEVLFMDADAMFLKNPEVVWNASEVYVKFGMLFFTDRGHASGIGGESRGFLKSFLKVPSRYAMENRFWRGQSKHEMESAVVVVDKGRLGVLHGLLAACKLNGFYEREVTYKKVYGDKETFWFGMELNRIPWSFTPSKGAYAGAIGFNIHGKVCGHNLHVDESHQPFWFNGGVIRHKPENPPRYFDISWWIYDLGDSRVQGRWKPNIDGTDQACLKYLDDDDMIKWRGNHSSSVVFGELGKEEKRLVDDYVDSYKKIWNVGGIDYLKGLKGNETNTIMSEDQHFDHLLPSTYKDIVTAWLAEDVPSFDYGGFVVGETDQVAVLYCKAKGVLAGVPFFNEVFRQVDCKVEWFAKEGAELDPTPHGGRIEVAKVYGKARNILLGERPALNMMARASGIATRSRKLLRIKQAAGWNGLIAGTRKTTPSFRLVEKYAMLVGGVDTHRVDLSSMIMLKDNHIWATGSITAAVHKARQAGGFALKIEVECRSEAEADEAIAAGADIIMLDNFDGSGFVVAAGNLKKRWSGKKHFLIEGSGGLTEENVAAYFSSDVDILSFGSITQSVPHIDFSLKVTPKK
ncbi:hypothetical protein HDU76_006306 [Blyttiomyces sp. JEL0837]|nr:hypothetical protein HDU76_006306 [Blyttiomyces sp. JEL0837]